MSNHVSKVTSTCLFQLVCLQQIRQLVGREVTAQLVQRVLNATAQLVVGLAPFDHCNAGVEAATGCPLINAHPIQTASTYALSRRQ